ncbi:MAG: Lrp/AsnC family transcriptional regulator [Meiothermus sp.]|nr:Lrp/AsnC family transcriptional regulator [Meiothermus sp.]
MVQLDSIDRAILLELQQESRLSYAEIGSRVGLSPAAVHDRVKKLEKKGVIKAYKIQVDPEALGLKLTAFVAIRLDNNSTGKELVPALGQFTEIEEMHSVAGETDVLLKVRVTDTKALERLIYRIKNVSGVARITSTIVLSTALEDRPLVPVEEEETARVLR